MKRTVIKINEELCDGCGACVTSCHEGAIQLIEGKAVLVGDLYCDGLGACIGECPTEAIEFEERDAEQYDEELVMEQVAAKGEKAINAHLNHLKKHGENKLRQQGIDFLKQHNITVNLSDNTEPLLCGCPGSMVQNFTPNIYTESRKQEEIVRQFPIQLHLLNPRMEYLKWADVLLAADCTAFICGDFYHRFMRGKELAIACPKLDSRTDTYVAKLEQMIDVACIDTLTVVIMEVPCCNGLLKIAQTAREKSLRHIPIKKVVVSVRGEIIKEEWT